MSEQCPSCPIHESCPLRGVVTYCSGPVDVSPWIDAIRKGITTVEEVADMFSEMASSEATIKEEG